MYVFSSCQLLTESLRCPSFLFIDPLYSCQSDIQMHKLDHIIPQLNIFNGYPPTSEGKIKNATSCKIFQESNLIFFFFCIALSLYIPAISHILSVAQLNCPQSPEAELDTLSKLQSYLRFISSRGVVTCYHNYLSPLILKSLKGRNSFHF